MIPNVVKREVCSSGVSASAEFGISKKDTSHIMGILRDTLYTDSILAVLREYSSNAWDANREAGKPDTPIKIHIPTENEPTLVIRDFGLGLSDRDVLELYTQYGASTKRKSNEVVGALGIGCKALFSYSDTFTVTSWHKGLKQIYVAALDNNDSGVMQRLHREPCPKNETGVEIRAAVQPKDVQKFQETAKNLFKYFSPVPDININISKLRDGGIELKNGTVYIEQNVYRERNWVALMGCIPYRVDINQVIGQDTDTFLYKVGNNFSGILKFEIGEVEVSANREELKYTDKTKNIILKRFSSLINEYIRKTLKELRSKKISSWKKRIRIRNLKEFGFPLGDIDKKWLTVRIELIPREEEEEEEEDNKKKKVEQLPFNILYKGSKVSQIPVVSKVKLIFRDDFRKIGNYAIDYYFSYIVSPKNKESIDKARRALEKRIKETEIDGIPIINISTLDYYEYQNSRNYKKNEKHQVTSFKWGKRELYSSRNKKSDDWDVVERIPTDKDVFVLIERFLPVGYGDYFYARYAEDKAIADLLKIPMPEIYGYKTTEKKPVTEEDCKGIPYRKWRETFFKNKISFNIKRLISRVQWKNIIGSEWAGSYYYNGTYKNIKDIKERGERIQKSLENLLGENHQIVKLFERHRKAVVALKKKNKQENIIEILIKRAEIEKPSPAEIAFNKIKEQYPLLIAYGGIPSLWTRDQEERKRWKDYIEMVDNYEKGKKNDRA